MPFTWNTNYLRMSGVGLLAAVLIGLVAIFAGHEIVLGVWKLALAMTGAFIGYWIDRIAFPYARPHALGADDETGVWTKYDPYGIVFAGCMVRRAFLMGAVMWAISGGL